MEYVGYIGIFSAFPPIGLTPDAIYGALERICAIPVDDGVSFALENISPIRDDDVYGVYRVKINAIFDTLRTPLSMGAAKKFGGYALKGTNGKQEFKHAQDRRDADAVSAITTLHVPENREKRRTVETERMGFCSCLFSIFYM